MKTRLTELLHVEHPVMLAGMGGVAYSVLAAAVSNAGGYGCLGASTMSSERLAHEIAATKELTDKPFGVDLLTAFPETLTHNVELLIEGGASTFVAGLGVPSHVIELCHDHGVLVVSMCGKVEHAKRALDAGLRPRRRPGHRGRRSHRHRRDAAARTAHRGRDGRRDPRGGRRRHLRRSRTRRRAVVRRRGVWIGTRFIATPEARAIPGYRESILETREDGTVVSRAFSGKTMRVLRNDTTDRYDADPSLLKKFPDQLAVAFNDGTFHLGGDEHTLGIDPRREGYPAGQAVGAITSIVPAGDIVRSIVDEAQRVIDGLRSL